MRCCVSWRRCSAARYLNNEPAAVQTWQALVELPENPFTYTGWRNIAAARVRDEDLNGAIAAYREADKRAPREDKAEIANRLGWLAKETGNTRASKRYFAKGRGDAPRITMTMILIAITVIVSVTAMFTIPDPPEKGLYDWLQLDKMAVAAGEYWRLWTVTLLHSPTDPLHLIFNMYALWLSGTIVERWYGSIRFLAFYLACAAAGSTASFVFGGDVPSVGASGAIFGLFGILLAAGRLHHPVDRQSRGIMSQLVVLVLINIAFGFASGGSIDNAAHLGGLAAGLFIGALVPPTAVPTLSSLWQRPVEQGVGAATKTAPRYIAVVAVAPRWRACPSRPRRMCRPRRRPPRPSRSTAPRRSRRSARSVASDRGPSCAPGPAGDRCRRCGGWSPGSRACPWSRRRGRPWRRRRGRARWGRRHATG